MHRTAQQPIMWPYIDNYPLHSSLEEHYQQYMTFQLVWQASLVTQFVCIMILIQWNLMENNRQVTQITAVKHDKVYIYKLKQDDKKGLQPTRSWPAVSLISVKGSTILTNNMF